MNESSNPGHGKKPCMKKLLFIFSAAALLVASQDANAQNLVWAKQFGGVSNDYGRGITVDAVGNIFAIGSFYDTVDFDPGPGTFNLISSGLNDIFIIKLDATGNLIWVKQFGGVLSDNGWSIALDNFGNLYAAGRFNDTVDFDPGPGTFNLVSSYFGSGFIAKLNSSGNLIWAKQSGEGGVMLDALGNIYVSGDFSLATDFDPGPGTFNLYPSGGQDVFISKLDAAGNFIWAKQLGGSSGDGVGAGAVDDAGNVFTTGWFQGTANFGLTALADRDAFITKHDSSGNLIWAKQFGGVNSLYIKNAGISIAVDNAGNVITSGQFQGITDFDPGPGTYNLSSNYWGAVDVFVTKLNASGNLVWAKSFGGISNDQAADIVLDAAGNVFASGAFHDTVDFDPGPGTFNLITSIDSADAFIIKLDTSGNLIWARQLGGPLEDYGPALFLDAAEDLYGSGQFQGTADVDPGPGTFNLTSAGQIDAFILKLTSSVPYVVQGNVFADLNGNCNRDSLDFTIPGMLIQAEPGPSYGMSGTTGNYSINLFDTGSYTISLASQDSLWQPTCSLAYNLQVATFPDTATGIDFGMTTGIYCPRLTVEIGTPSLRPCLFSNYFIRYRNTGTLPASNAYIEVDFGNNLLPYSSTIPWSSVNGNIYTFPIGTINLFQQGSFNVTTRLDCRNLLGTTQCVTAHIYPDSSCLPAPIGWDKSETQATGTCVNDSLVCFIIKNRSGLGTGDMNGAAQWRLYVNDTLITQGTYQLNGGDSIIKCYSANGKTYRLEADQNAPHPGNPHPKAIVEACGSPANFGFVNTVPQDDEDLFIETFCMTVTGSYDPNDKQVSPVGITSNKYITSEDELEYLIRFQNTGTDTAFKVVIRDTITTDVLDIATLTSGASSHDYTFNIYGHGIAEWTFDNILLPDSNVNEPESHGFVKFKVQQLSGNTDGTLIENRAAIYFDFNAPVITNTAWNVVNEANMPVSFLSANVNASNISCNGLTNGHATASATGGLAPYQYSWSNGSATATVSNLLAGNYSVTITDATGTALVDSVSITEPSLLSASIVSQTNVLCFANGTGDATASATGGTTPYSYEWSNTQGSSTATSLNAGTYTVTVWDANLCTATTSSITITEPPQLTASISTQSSVTCFGGNDAAVKVITNGGVPPHSFNWSNGQTSSTANDLSGGNHLVTITDANGCFLITSVTIQDGYQVNTGTITGADTADINQTNSYSVNAGFTYTWNITNGTIISGQSTNSVEVDWSATGQGTLQVIATDQGCLETVLKTVTLVDPTGIQNDLLNGIELYPNPTNGTLTLKAANITTTASLKLYDSIGKKILQQNAKPDELQQGIIIDLNDMNEGIFFLSIKTESGTRVMKVVKL